MTTKISTFSNGHTDRYQGKRNVKAGWMIVTPDGAIKTGHSMDAIKAEKTARATAAEFSGIHALYTARGPVHAGYIAARDQEARDAGFAHYRDFHAHVATRRAAWVASCNIEIVEVEG